MLHPLGPGVVHSDQQGALRAHRTRCGDPATWGCKSDPLWSPPSSRWISQPPDCSPSTPQLRSTPPAPAPAASRAGPCPLGARCGSTDARRALMATLFPAAPRGRQMRLRAGVCRLEAYLPPEVLSPCGRSLHWKQERHGNFHTVLDIFILTFLPRFGGCEIFPRQGWGGRGREGGRRRERGTEGIFPQEGGRGVAPGFRHPRRLSSCPLPISEGSQVLESPRHPSRPRPPPGRGLRARRCHYTSRDPRTGPVPPEASRGVLIKGHSKTDLPAHRGKCPPGKGKMTPRSSHVWSPAYAGFLRSARRAGGRGGSDGGRWPGAPGAPRAPGAGGKGRRGAEGTERGAARAARTAPHPRLQAREARAARAHAANPSVSPALRRRPGPGLTWAGPRAARHVADWGAGGRGGARSLPPPPRPRSSCCGWEGAPRAGRGLGGRSQKRFAGQV